MSGGWKRASYTHYQMECIRASLPFYDRPLITLAQGSFSDSNAGRIECLSN